MKIKDAVVWPWRWLTPLGPIQENTPVDDGILIEARVSVVTLNITLIVHSGDGRYYGSVRTPKREAYPWVPDFLRRNKGRRLRDVIDREMDFPEAVLG